MCSKQRWWPPWIEGKKMQGWRASQRVIKEQRKGREMNMTGSLGATKGPGRPYLVYPDLSPVPAPQPPLWFPKRARHGPTPGSLHLLFCLGSSSVHTRVPVASPPSLFTGHLPGGLSLTSAFEAPASPPNTHPLTHTALFYLSPYLLPLNKLVI